MEPYITPFLTFIGGGFVLAIVNYLINRRKAGLEVSGLKDDQTAKWRDNALHLSEEIIEKNKEISRLFQRLSQCDCPEEVI